MCGSRVNLFWRMARHWTIKIQQKDITFNDKDNTIGLCDSNMMKLIKDILAKHEVLE